MSTIGNEPKIDGAKSLNSNGMPSKAHQPGIYQDASDKTWQKVSFPSKTLNGAMSEFSGSILCKTPTKSSFFHVWFVFGSYPPCQPYNDVTTKLISKVIDNLRPASTAPQFHNGNSHNHWDNYKSLTVE